MNYDASAEYDDGSCEFEVLGCTDEAACNYDADANTDDGSCAELDCDGVCGGSAVIDDCGLCNGPGAIYDCGCSDIPEGDCDCDGNQLDALGECGGPCEADADMDGICAMLIHVLASLTTAASATVLARSTTAAVLTSQQAIATATATSSTPLASAVVLVRPTLMDGICDDVDPCVGELDACGICNGPGAIYDCGCSDIPAGDCDCDGNSSTPLASAWSM